MIIFDLDGTLADCENRRHFIDPSKNNNYSNEVHSLELIEAFECDEPMPEPRYKHKISGEKFKPDWKSFYESCDKDEPIKEVIQIFHTLSKNKCFTDIEIWSGRCESVREKTLKWLLDCMHIVVEPERWFKSFKLKMRPIGDYTPDDKLKEKWLDERCKHVSLDLNNGKTTRDCHDIQFVFDSHPKSIKMWRRRGIFVFNCCQYDEEF